ncbi:MAG: hypothetical protein HKO87_08865, partial [Acidimicrobiia bacterium]|nr:hypothetical protein [Acidimicrobiia bacterium]
MRAALNTHFAGLAAVVLALVLGGYLIFHSDPEASAAVRIADPSIWFETASAGVVVEVNTSSHDVQSTVQVSEPGQRLSIFAGSTRLAVANHDTRTLSILDRGTQRITHLLDLGTAPGAIELTGAGDVAAVIGAARVDRIELESVEHTVVGFTGGVSTARVAESGEIIAIDGDGQAVHFMDLDDVEFERVIELPTESSAPQLTSAGADVVLVDTDRLVVQTIRNRTLSVPRCLSTRSPDAIPGSSSPDAGELALVDERRDQLLLSPLDDGSREQCRHLEFDAAGSSFGPPLVNNTTAYVPNWATGEVIRIDLRDAQQTSIPFVAPGVRFDVLEHGGQVWANDPNGRMAALVDVDAAATLIPKFSLATLGVPGDGGRGRGLTMVGNDGSRDGVTVLDEAGDQLAGLAAGAPERTA